MNADGGINVNGSGLSAFTTLNGPGGQRTLLVDIDRFKRVVLPHSRKYCI